MSSKPVSLLATKDLDSSQSATPFDPGQSSPFQGNLATLPNHWDDQADTSRDSNPFANLTRTPHSRLKQVWAVGGGKGGVGKSLVASSLAISLARTGAKVVAIDLDLGGANLHTSLGIELPQATLGDFTSFRENDLGACLTSTQVPNLHIISGAQDAVSAAEIRPDQKTRLMQKILELDADYVLLDLGAGTSNHTVDFYLMADIGIITLLPEPTSIENGYRFIKSTYYRHLKASRDLASCNTLIDAAMDPRNTLGLRSPSDLFREVNRNSPESGMRLKRSIEQFNPKLLINQARTQTDVDIGFSVKTVCKKYFGADMDYIGYLDYDSAVWQAIRRKRPLMLEFPNSRLVSSLDRMTQYLVKRCSNQKCELY